MPLSLVSAFYLCTHAGFPNLSRCLVVITVAVIWLMWNSQLSVGPYLNARAFRDTSFFCARLGIVWARLQNTRNVYPRTVAKTSECGKPLSTWLCCLAATLVLVTACLGTLVQGGNSRGSASCAAGGGKTLAVAGSCLGRNTLGNQQWNVRQETPAACLTLSQSSRVVGLFFLFLSVVQGSAAYPVCLVLCLRSQLCCLLPHNLCEAPRSMICAARRHGTFSTSCTLPTLFSTTSNVLFSLLIFTLSNIWMPTFTHLPQAQHIMTSFETFIGIVLPRSIDFVF